MQGRWFARFSIALLAAMHLLLLGLIIPVAAQTTKNVQWIPGPGSENYFRRLREGSPSTCKIVHARAHGIPNVSEATVLMELDCRNSLTGGKIVFDSFRSRNLQGGWKLHEVRTDTRDSTNRTRVEWLRVPRTGDKLLETRVRLVAERRKRAVARVHLVGVLPAEFSAPEVMWCDGAFTCSDESDCQQGYICSRDCGTCVRPN